jgi:hypothetical protein
MSSRCALPPGTLPSHTALGPAAPFPSSSYHHPRPPPPPPPRADWHLALTAQPGVGGWRRVSASLWSSW